MKRLVKLLALLALLVALPAWAQKPPEGWRPWKTGDFAVSPVNLGPAIFVNGGSGVAFGLFNDFDYHVAGGAAIGGMFNFAFRSGFVGMQFGPQFKYKFTIGNTSHTPYVRAGLPFALGFPSGGDTQFGIGVVWFGGGYKYFFHRMIGAGMDVSFVPTVVAAGGGGSNFVFNANIMFGIEIRP